MLCFPFSRFQCRSAIGRTLPTIAGRRLPVALQEDFPVVTTSGDVIKQLRDVIVHRQESIAVTLAGFVVVVVEGRRSGREGLQGRHGHGGVHRYKLEIFLKNETSQITF